MVQHNLTFARFAHFVGCSCLLIALLGCKKFVEADPPKTQLSGAVVFENDATAKAAVLGIYSRMMESNSNFSSGPQGLSLLAGLSADEFQANSSDKRDFYLNSLNSTNSSIMSIWTELYRYIYNANDVIEKLNTSSNVSAGLKAQLQAEAKFIRGFCYLYLVNLWGDVPLITTTDYRANQLAPRTDKSQIYEQIVTDLKEAKEDLPGDYSGFGNERTRPNKWAAAALLARVYLYTGNWTSAEAEASSVINASAMYALVNELSKVFLKTSSEAIWQLAPVLSNGINTFDGATFILTTSPNPVSVGSPLFNAFEAGDLRKQNWIASATISSQVYYYSYKYKVKVASSSPVTEYLMVIRLAELYLIRAEAWARQNDLSRAVSDINTIRTRAGLAAVNLGTQPEVLAAIDRERRVELFAEMGHRWVDLKRTNSANTVLGPLKGNNWQPFDILYPIPKTEIDKDPNLTQNPGYN